MNNIQRTIVNLCQVRNNDSWVGNTNGLIKRTYRNTKTKKCPKISINSMYNFGIKSQISAESTQQDTISCVDVQGEDVADRCYFGKF